MRIKHMGKGHATMIRTVLILSFVLALAPGLASAHVLKGQNGISAVLHIPPDDNPRAGEVATLYFSFADEKSAFNIQDCDCHITVTLAGQPTQEIQLSPSSKNASLTSLAKVTFPAGGVYDVDVDGESKTNSFKSFGLDYPVRVAPARSVVAARSDKGDPILLIGAGGLAILILIAFVSISSNERYKPAPKKSDKDT